jgi:hypothetical protein
MPVRVRHCRGIGAPRREGASIRYDRFACVAGARLQWEEYDSVAVLYRLRPRDEYEGGRSKYTLEHVRFVGGPGIP